MLDSIGLEFRCGCWDPTPVLTIEQQVPFTAELSVRPSLPPWYHLLSPAFAVVSFLGCSKEGNQCISPLTVFFLLDECILQASLV